MDCNQFMKLSSKLIDNEASLFAALKLKFHLKKCKKCEDYYEKQLILIENLKNLPEINPPANLKKRILTEFEMRKKTASAGLRLKYSKKPLKALALSCAAAGVIAGFSLANKTFELKSDTISSGTYVLAVNSDKGDLF